MDDTVVTPKSGAKFAKDANDWRFLFDNVSSTIKKLYTEGFKVVIFSNQLGISKGHTKAQDVKTKVANLASQMGI